MDWQITRWYINVDQTSSLDDDWDEAIAVKNKYSDLFDEVLYT